MQCKHTDVTISTRARNENVMKYVNSICYSYNNNKKTDFHTENTGVSFKRSANFSSEIQVERMKKKTHYELNQMREKWNMVTEMICDFIFVDTISMCVMHKHFGLACPC